jgi:hypothetical protein
VEGEGKMIVPGVGDTDRLEVLASGLARTLISSSALEGLKLD